jgi:hypothetical protein
MNLKTGIRRFSRFEGFISFKQRFPVAFDLLRSGY